MNARGIFALCIALFFSTRASAESNWVDLFLKRYSTTPVQGSQVRPTPSATPATLGALVQNGAIALTTEDIVRLLLQNNRDVLVNRYAPLSDLYAISTFYKLFEPNVHASANVSRTNTPSRSQLSGAAALSQLTHDYRVGFSQNLLTGTVLGVDFDLNRSSSNSSFNLFNPAWNGLITYSLTQHVLRDFGRSVNAHQIRIARNTEKMSELQFELQVIDLVVQAQQAYWDLVFANEDVKIKQRSLDLAEKTLHDNELQVQIGTLAQIDLVQAESDRATRRDDLVTSQSTSDQLQDQVKKLISNDTDPGVVVAQLNLIQPVPQPQDEALMPLDKAIQFALENRAELRQADYDIQNQNINVEYLKNQRRPVLDVNAAYTQSGLGGTQTIRSGGIGQSTTVSEVIPGGIGDVFNQLFGFNFSGYSAGLSLVVPIGNRSARANYDKALNERQLSEMRKNATAQRIALEVRNAYTQVVMNRARIDTAKTAHDLAIRKLDAEQKKFQLGTSTVRFVLEEQRNLAQAETNEIQALVNYTKSLVMYDKAIGDTLRHNNIELMDQLPKQLTSDN